MLKSIENKLIRMIIKASQIGPAFVTVIVIAISEAIYTLVMFLIGIHPELTGFLITFLVPLLTAYPSLWVLLRVTRTTQQQNEDIKIKNSLKNTLLSVVAHDVKGPLINIDSLLDLYFQKDIDQEELFSLLKELQQQVKTNLDFVMNILQWTKTQFDGFQIIKTSVDLQQLIQRIIDAYQFQIQQKKIKVEVNVNGTVNIDRNLMRLVLRNLISNAIKYTGQGGLITIRSNIEDGILTTTVTDNGQGMDAAKLNELFNEHALNSNTGKYNETGIGLKLCKTFIDALGGEIGATSKPKEGSSFYFTIPL